MTPPASVLLAALMFAGCASLSRGQGEARELTKLTTADVAALAISGDWAVIGTLEGGAGGSADAFGGLSDCNGNDLLDTGDDTDRTSDDASNNGLPDECEGPVPTVSAWGMITILPSRDTLHEVHCTKRNQRRVRLADRPARPFGAT